MSGARLTTVTIKGNDHVVYVSTTGKFYVEDDVVGRVEGETLEACTAALRRVAARQQKKIEVEVSLLGVIAKRTDAWRKDNLELVLDTGKRDTTYGHASLAEKQVTITDGVLRGQNPRTHALLLTIDNQKLQSDGYWNPGKERICRRLTDEEKAQYIKVRADAANAIKALVDFEKRVGMGNVKALLGTDTEADK